MTRDIKLIKTFYAKLPQKIAAGRRLFHQPLTLTEKLLIAHLHELPRQIPERHKTYVHLDPDRVAMQDATAQMALLQFMQAGKKRVAVPSTVHCDHLIRAHNGATVDLEQALEENNEVYAFLKSISSKYGIGFWKPGSGIIHQVILENYAFPGSLMIGTDSHTPNAGGLGMLAIGVGGADACDAMAGMSWELQWPGIIGVKLTGQLNGWTSAKDVILKLAGILTVKGGTGKIIEYFGSGIDSISCTGKATISNMGAEIGATTSIFPFDKRMIRYLSSTERDDLARMTMVIADHLTADPEVLHNPELFYDEIIEIDLDRLEPHVVGPYTPDLTRPISQLKDDIQEKGYPETLACCLVGSCTNSSYEDIGRAAHIAKQALDKGLTAQTEFLITPGSERVRATIERDGQLAILEKIGAMVLANACGPCIGQWKRSLASGEKNAILTSFNRNFARRNDGNSATMAFIASPEIVTALALAGRLDFNPLTDTLKSSSGEAVKLMVPIAEELPIHGFATEKDTYIPPSDHPDSIHIQVSPQSKRLQLLSSFSPWDGQDFEDLLLLVKAKGKCTTDHISPAGPWLRYRGHLDKISDNLFSGVINAFNDETGQGRNILSGEAKLPFAKIARQYKASNHGWIAIGDENYGEGSSREHAAMEPRHLGCRVVIVKSFARIHESNLKKQGILPLIFINPDDYNHIQESDRISILGLKRLDSTTQLTIKLLHENGNNEKFQVKHALSELQIGWFKAGSALNYISGHA